MTKKQGTILIVDDNRNILTTVRMLLEPIFNGIITIANPNSSQAERGASRRGTARHELLQRNQFGKRGIVLAQENQEPQPENRGGALYRLCRHPTCRNRHQGRCLRLHREAF